jgi:hypothetical protein
MRILLGSYKVTWGYDPMKNISYCVITDEEDYEVIQVHAKRHSNDPYDKAKVRSVTFKKALKQAEKKHLLSRLDIENLRTEFNRLPNNGAI